MSELGQHSHWLSLMDVSGPFLAEPVLKIAFPQGLEGLDSEKKRTLRQAYEEWREAIDLDDPDLLELHQAWVELVLKKGLELDEAGTGEVLKAKGELPNSLECRLPEYGMTLRPDFAVVDREGTGLLLVATYAPDTSLRDASIDTGWVSSPADRMVELCRGCGVRLGLITNGEQWMLIDAPTAGATTFASWFARLWNSEPVTLQAFTSLLGIRRFFVDRSEQLPALLAKSLEHQDEVTDALGEQVRRAVEVLIQALDRADVDRNRELLKGIEPSELYEAGLTVMMRIVFLLSAEERGLLLLGDERYEANYAVSTLRTQLRLESEEILERRWDAWSRLLSSFRVVFSGIDHAALRLPALGGSLFDPDRFPFLEGRPKGSSWRLSTAVPLPIDNRTVLLLLDAVQLFHGRTISYQSLNVEQIGYVYEGLLERTVSRAEQVTLDLKATQSAKRPWVTLTELDDAAASGRDSIEKLLKDRTGSSVSRVKNDLDKEIEQVASEKILTACHGNKELRDRIKPYTHFLRVDPWGYPLIYPKGTFTVTSGGDRRETGTHYTPKSLTEAVIKDTLEPLVYRGPSEGLSRERWQLKLPAELLDLKICDPAMGSGAFLVQVCRWLSEKLVGAWQEAEKQGKVISVDGEVLDTIGSLEPMRRDLDEQLLVARRLIAERCLYGVDANPLAVELAKLSVWLVTLAKGRPFGFLDHNLRSGDSLVGIHTLDQLLSLEMNPRLESAKRLFASQLDDAIQKSLGIRLELRSRPIRDIRDVEVLQSLNSSARDFMRIPSEIATALVSEAIIADGKPFETTSLSIEVGNALNGAKEASDAIALHFGKARKLLASRSLRAPFHWPLEFPEVFMRNDGGFDAFVGNPPFLGGKLISGAFGPAYQKYLVSYLTFGQHASVDLVVNFFVRVFSLLRSSGCVGLLGRRSLNEATNRSVGLAQIIEHGGTIYRANTNMEWPGKAAVVVHQVNFTRRQWLGDRALDGITVDNISEELTNSEVWAVEKLSDNLGRIFQGSILSGEGFKITEARAASLLAIDEGYNDVIFPFVGGSEINTDPSCNPICWVICFWDWSAERSATQCPEVFEIVDQLVKPERQRRKPNGEFRLRQPMPQRWWQYGEKRPALYHAIGRGAVFENHPEGWSAAQDSPDRVLAISTGTTKYPAFTFLPPNLIYSNKLCVLADDRFSIFAILSSDVHSVWAWSQKTTLQNNMESMRYAHGNIFETFPFPRDLLSGGDANLDRLGAQFFELRQEFMLERNVGLTEFYNAFHDHAQLDQTLIDLRSRQVDINTAVLASYGWDDLVAATDFHQVGYLPVGRNIRFTISEEARLELLRRLARENRRLFLAQGELIVSEFDDEHDDLFAMAGKARRA